MDTSKASAALQARQEGAAGMRRAHLAGVACPAGAGEAALALTPAGAAGAGVQHQLCLLIRNSPVQRQRMQGLSRMDRQRELGGRCANVCMQGWHDAAGG